MTANEETVTVVKHAAVGPTEAVLLVNDIPKPPPVPEGKIRTVDGKIIDRANACFGYVEHKDDPNILLAADGMAYLKMPSGVLKRLTFKKHERKAMRRKETRNGNPHN